MAGTRNSGGMVLRFRVWCFPFCVDMFVLMLLRLECMSFSQLLKDTFSLSWCFSIRVRVCGNSRDIIWALGDGVPSFFGVFGRSLIE